MKTIARSPSRESSSDRHPFRRSISRTLFVDEIPKTLTLFYALEIPFQELCITSILMREGEETKYVMLWTESLATTSNPAIPPRWPIHTK